MYRRANVQWQLVLDKVGITLRVMECDSQRIDLNSNCCGHLKHGQIAFRHSESDVYSKPGDIGLTPHRSPESLFQREI